MIKIEKVVTPSGEQWDAIIRGMRNPKNSWDRMDSDYRYDCRDDIHKCPKGGYRLGPNDHELMTKLARGGAVHAKYRRTITVYLDITAPLYWWKEFDTYKVGTVSNSCSTMHKIHEKVFTLEDFSHEHLVEDMFDEVDFAYPNDEGGYDSWTPCAVLSLVVSALNEAREQYLIADEKLKRKDLTDAERKHVTAQKKHYWWQMIQLLPSSYNQKRTIMLNYEVLVGMYRDRKTHKLDEWKELCKWIETLPYSELITGGK